MRKYKYILFDLDGTLIYSHPGIYSGFRYALKKMGRTDEPSDTFLRRCVGPSLMYSFENFFDMNEEDAAKATAFYREEYSRSGVRENEPIEYATECLKALKQKGYKLALATSKPLFYAAQITKRLGFDSYLDEQVGSGMDGSLPTKASVIGECLRLFSATREECLMIGDRKHDVEGAKEQGVDCAMVKVGYAEEGEYESSAPNYVFEDLAALTAFLTE